MGFLLAASLILSSLSSITTLHSLGSRSDTSMQARATAFEHASFGTDPSVKVLSQGSSRCSDSSTSSAC